MQKMGVVHNLPLYWDDVSKPDQLERATEIASAGTEGIEGGKLKSSRESDLPRYMADPYPDQFERQPDRSYPADIAQQRGAGKPCVRVFCPAAR